MYTFDLAEQCKAKLLAQAQVADLYEDLELENVSIPSRGVEVEESAPGAIEELNQQQSDSYDRGADVRDAVKSLRESITGYITSAFQLNLTEEQLAELTEIILSNINDEVTAVTLERIKDIANDMLIQEK